MVTEVIRQKWFDVPSSTSTRNTEIRLGIVGEPLYCFAMRSERAFGAVVFALRLKAQRDSTAYGATPFDSGGMWVGRVQTAPELTSEARRRLFRENDIPLAAFPHAV